MVSISPELEEKLKRREMMARLPKAATRHDLDRMIVGNQILTMRALVTVGETPTCIALKKRIADTEAWWRSHYSEDVTVMPALKED